MVSELYHYGVLGQKWGVRRYQPYPKGEKVKGGKEIGEAAKVQQRDSSPKVTRSSSESSGASRVSKSDNIKESTEDSSRPTPKNPREMTGDELREAVARMQLEKQYADLFRTLYPAPQPKVSAGKKFIKEVGGKILKDSITKAGTEILTNTIKSAFIKTSEKASNNVNVKEGKKKAQDIVNDFNKAKDEAFKSEATKEARRELRSAKRKVKVRSALRLK